MRLWKSTPSSATVTESESPTLVVRSPAPPTQDDVREAYARGRRDERARHRRSPLMVVAFSLAAVTGAALLASAALRGSFERGGALVDQQIVTAAEEATPALKAAAHKAGRALKGETKAGTTSLTGG